MNFLGHAVGSIFAGAIYMKDFYFGFDKNFLICIICILLIALWVSIGLPNIQLRKTLNNIYNIIMSILIIINDQPSSGKTWNALRLSAALVGKDEEVEIFLMNDGVFNVMKNQKAPTEIEGQMTSHKIKN